MKSSQMKTKKEEMEELFRISKRVQCLFIDRIKKLNQT